jgi:transcriptional regulator with XRE-family HTH domain
VVLLTSGVAFCNPADLGWSDRQVADVQFGDAASPSTANSRRPAVTAVHGPLTGRRRLRSALKRAREQAGQTQEQVAAAMDWSTSKLIRIEAGTVGISTNDLRALLTHYGIVEHPHVEGLLELARMGRRKPWWFAYRDQLPTPAYGTLIDLEADASQLCIFGPSFVPGLLQTADYARAVLQRVAPKRSPEEVEAQVAVRVRRVAEVLGQKEPPVLSVVLDEVVLRRGTTVEVTRAQLHHLLSLAGHPRITIRILPFSAGVYPLTSAFFVISFADDEPDVVYVEGGLDDGIIEDEGQVEDYRATFAALEQQALDPAASADLIARVADGLG